MNDGDHLALGDVILPLGGVTHLMGVVNVSPDSKNMHTVARSVEDAVIMADRYRNWGASVIDVGGQSSHYENPTIDAALEVERVTPIVAALSAEGHLVAIDTWKPEVAGAAVEVGATLVNDTGGLSDAGMRAVVSAAGVAAVAVHVEAANPHEVGEFENSESKANDVASRFAVLLNDLADEGIHNVIIDPGIALNYRGDYEAYTRMQMEVIEGSAALHALGKPVLIPIPRKRDFHRVAAYITLALEHGADMIRVHDVALAADLARLFGRMP